LANRYSGLVDRRETFVAERLSAWEKSYSELVVAGKKNTMHGLIADKQVLNSELTARK
jgi:hypothetical protein